VVKLLEIFGRFALVSLLAFGGGAGTPLVERVAVRETGWIPEREFAIAMGLAQVAPGPVMMVTTFIGTRAAGPSGGLAAALGTILAPWGLAALLARHLGRLPKHRRLAGFRRGVTAGAVGLYGMTTVALARDAVPGAAHALIAAVSLGLAMGTKIHPGWILLGGALVGLVVGSPSGP
jgi:chromate transporter